MASNDTIAAIATSHGRGGVGVVRISGPQAVELANRLFRPASKNFTGFKPRFMHHGRLLDENGRRIDDILAVFMPGPRSFTGEDVVELHCHGGPAILSAALGALYAMGARPAEPGEFTKRAFLAGRMDLAQAEAVAEMINAPTRPALSLAQNRLDGGLSRRIGAMRDNLLHLRAGLAAAVDFPEEELECLPPEEIACACRGVLDELAAMLEAAKRSRPWRQGALVVLAGPVNAGKSSLLNALLGRKRAIVTDLPGTTRDFLEEALDLDGLPVRLVDTAGLRDALDPAEQAGLDAGKSLAAQADLVLLVVDESRPLASDVETLLELVRPDRVLVAANKSDLPSAEDRRPSAVLSDNGLEFLGVSALRGDNLQGLVRRMRERIAQEYREPDADEMVPNARQAKALADARTELESLAKEAADGVPYDLLGVRLETACAHLASITGEITPARVLDEIFSRFCIGK
ncbi:MAG: tRNA uridine-5-carboxymethylaminomethyl(34) synthesis GTPase MnmE [Desulfovibrionaceae bacterium]